MANYTQYGHKSRVTMNDIDSWLKRLDLDVKKPRGNNLLKKQYWVDAAREGVHKKLNKTVLIKGFTNEQNGNAEYIYSVDPEITNYIHLLQHMLERLARKILGRELQQLVKCTNETT